MKKYRSDSSTILRYEFGVELGAGLSQYPETQPRAVTFGKVNVALLAQYKARLDLREPLLLCRANMRFSCLRTKRAIRGLFNAAKQADGNRRGVGPIATALFPEGISPIVKPRGRNQMKPLKDLINRLALAKTAGIDDFRTEQLPKLQAAQKDFEAAIAQYDAAKEAHDLAFQAEKALRDQHYDEVESVIGFLRSTFPHDREVQETIFPPVDRSDSVDDTHADEPNGEPPAAEKPALTSASAAAPAPAPAPAPASAPASASA
jgi:hypothetical protein